MKKSETCRRARPALNRQRNAGHRRNTRPWPGRGWAPDWLAVRDLGHSVVYMQHNLLSLSFSARSMFLSFKMEAGPVSRPPAESVGKILPRMRACENILADENYYCKRIQTRTMYACQ
jgi:hypothetical protein